MVTYGKLNGTEVEYFVPFKGGLLIDNMVIINPTREQYASQGYYPVELVAEDGENTVKDGILYKYIGAPRAVTTNEGEE